MSPDKPNDSPNFNEFTRPSPPDTPPQAPTSNKPSRITISKDINNRHLPPEFQQERHVDVKLVPESVLQPGTNNNNKKPPPYVVDDKKRPSENKNTNIVETTTIYSTTKDVKKPPAVVKDSKPVYVVPSGDSVDVARSKYEKKTEVKRSTSPRPEKTRETPKKPSGENSISQLLRCIFFFF